MPSDPTLSVSEMTTAERTLSWRGVGLGPLSGVVGLAGARGDVGPAGRQSGGEGDRRGRDAEATGGRLSVTGHR